MSQASNRNMAKQDKITLEAVGEFPFTFFIEKAIATEKKDKDGLDEYILEGIASTTNLDHDSERMSESALRSMEAVINEVGVPLRVEHQKEDEAVIGKVFEARVDDRNQLHVKARLDKSHPASSILYNSMKTGAKMGLSVGGLVKRAVRELSEKTGKMVKTFYDVALKEVSVTPRPANYDSWLVAKSITENEGEGDRFRDSAIYQDFLFENPQLNYLHAFAKSIPDGAWHKLASEDTNTMNTDETKEKTGEKDGESTEKAVTRGEFDAMKSLMAKGFESLGALVSKALNIEAHDQNAPGKDKPKEVGDEMNTAKAEGDAEDQANPKKDKPKEVGDGTAKTTANGTDEDGTREKASETDETKEKKTTDDKYDLQTVERSIEAIKSIQTRLDKMTDETKETKEKTSDEDKETKEKAEDSKEEDETTKGMHPIDVLAATIAKAFDTMVTKMEKNGKSIPGFEKHFINSLRQDPAFQEEIAKMMKQPGFKKSVAMGTPYVKTKDGRSFALTMSEVGAPSTLEKSRGKEGEQSFKSLYKSDFASFKEEA